MNNKIIVSLLVVTVLLSVTSLAFSITANKTSQQLLEKQQKQTAIQSFIHTNRTALINAHSKSERLAVVNKLKTGLDRILATHNSLSPNIARAGRECEREWRFLLTEAQNDFEAYIAAGGDPSLHISGSGVDLAYGAWADCVVDNYF